MKWLVKNKKDLENIEQVGFNKFVLNLSQINHTPKAEDTWDIYDTQYFQVVIEGDPTTFRVKQELIKLQNEYDTSEEVNSFTINGTTTWLDRNTRIALKNSISVMEAKGDISYTIWLGTTQMTLPISVIKSFLDSLEVYAIQAFNVTQRHLAEISEIEDRDELFTYDISEGYPEKININLFN